MSESLDLNLPEVEDDSILFPGLDIGQVAMEVEALNLWYGETQALDDISLKIGRSHV